MPNRFDMIELPGTEPPADEQDHGFLPNTLSSIAQAQRSVAEQAQGPAPTRTSPRIIAPSMPRIVAPRHTVVSLNPPVIRVDFDAPPDVPDGMTLEKDQLPNLVRGVREVNLLTDVRFHLDPGQQGGRTIRGFDLGARLARLPALYGAQLFDALWANREVIPETWKLDEQGRIRYIFFWTKFRDSFGRLYVRCLYFGDGSWSRRYCWLDSRWDVQDPAAVLAS